MERDRLDKAADVITTLLKAHVSDSAEEVDVYEAMAVRDDLREEARNIESEEFEYYVPNVGEKMYDPKTNSYVEVVRVSTDIKSRAKCFKDSSGKIKSVATANPDCDPDAFIIKAKYNSDSGGKGYHFPADRLKKHDCR